MMIKTDEADDKRCRADVTVTARPKLSPPDCPMQLRVSEKFLPGEFA